MNDLECVLINLLQTMDLPAHRKNAKPANLRWLRKNLVTYNGMHRQFVNAIRIIDILLKR